MDRRKFFAKSGVAAAALIGLPHAIRKKETQSATSYYKSAFYNKPKETQYFLSFKHTGIQNFATAGAGDKTIELNASYYEMAGQTTPNKTGKFKFIIYKTERIDQANNIWRVFARLDQKVSGDADLPADFAKELKLNVKPVKYAEILSAKNSALVALNYYDPLDDMDEDCFLTTACVHHRQLPDDCDELETLRGLRDNYMMKNKEGQILVKEYGIIGPAVVSAIRNFQNRADIYEYLYQHLVLPSVKLIREDKKQEAVEYYACFVEAMKEKYL